MYGKYFASTFTGSMFGAGPDVFAVWGYVIANVIDSAVELNPSYLSAVLGTTPERVKAAIDVLCAPDAASRTPAEAGRRLLHEAGFAYTVVNHAVYRAMRNEEDRRAYNREAKRRERVNVKRTVNDIHEMSNMSAHTEAEAEADIRSKSTRTKDARDETLGNVTVTPRHAPSRQQERDARAAPIISKRRGHAAWEGAKGLYVPLMKHQDFIGLRNHPGAEAELLIWYETVAETWQGSPGADMLKFWTARFEEQWPAPATTKPLPWANWKPKEERS